MRPESQGLATMIRGSRPRVLINGQACDSVSSLDRGLLYGDGLFETIAVDNGTPRFWRRHLARLFAGCARLGILPPPGTQLLEEAGALVTGVDRGVLKLIVTRGCGGRGYHPADATTPTRILQLHPWPDYAEHCGRSGIRMRLCRLRLGHAPTLAGIKHLNRLEQVLARAEWGDPAIMEGLLLDEEERVVEGTMSNVFAIGNGVLMTPALDRCGVAGVLRTVVMELAAGLPIPVQVGRLGLDDLRTADEVFLTNSLIGIWPVTAFEDRSYPSGILTRRLQERLANLPSDGEAWLN
jgi:4-amino-4-deoxychorismate lyase